MLDESIYHISHADLLIVAGTSLTVYPASGLIDYFGGKNLVILNRSTTDFDNRASLIIKKNLKEIFEKLN